MRPTRGYMREHILEPAFQTGDKAIVLGAREGNIGGTIAEYFCQRGWIACEDDCYHAEVPAGSSDAAEYYFYSPYQAPREEILEPYDACIITLGATHMEPFSEVKRSDFRKVIYGSLELPLECARRYVHARLRCEECGSANLQRAGSIRVCGVCGSNYPLDARKGVIVFMGSYAHDHPFTHCTSYCTAKAGLDMAARCLAWELMPEGFDVFIVHPHHVQGTPMTDEVLKGMQKGVHKMSEKEAHNYQRKDLRLPELLTPEVIASVVHYLITDKNARWLAGTSVNLYGGVR